MSKQEMDKDSKEIIKLKTICEYLIPDRFQEIADFSRFEICFQPLFTDTKISIKSVFDTIVGKQRKYITYGRLLESFTNYQKKLYDTEEFKDIKLFYDRLMTSILKFDTDFIGMESESNNYLSSNNFINDKKYSISKLTLLCDFDRNIMGVELRYNEEYKIRLAPKNLVKAFDINLNILVDLDENYQLRDAITHVFGTINQDCFITFIGFKCISGTTKCFGTPRGESFLFGEFGKKIQCMSVDHDDHGVTRLQITLAKNYLTNTNFNIDLNSYDKNRIYYDEDLLKKSENNEETIEKIKRTQIVGRKVNEQGYDKVLVQTPLNYLIKKALNQKIDEIKDKKTALKKSRITNNNATVIFNPIKDYSTNTISLNPFIPLKEPENKNKFGGVTISNPFYSKGGLSGKVKSLFKFNLSMIVGKSKRKSISQISHKSKAREVESKFLKTREDVVNNIYEQVQEKCGGKIDMETQIALNKIIGTKDENEKEEKEEKENKTEEEANEEKKMYTEFLIDKLGLKKNKEEANKVLLNLFNKKEDDKLLKLKTINEDDEEEIENIGKTMIQVNNKKKEKDKEISTQENTKEKEEEKKENAFLDNIKLLSKLNNFKVKEKTEEEKEIIKEEEEEEEEDQEIDEEPEPMNDNDVSIKQRINDVNSYNKFLEGNDLDEDERKEMETAMNKDKICLNKVMNEERNKNRMSLKRANKLVIDNWNEKIEESREQQRQLESQNLLKNLLCDSYEKPVIQYIIYKSFFTQEITKKIFLKQNPPIKFKTWSDDKFGLVYGVNGSLCEKKLEKKWKAKEKASYWCNPNYITNFNNYCVFQNDGPSIYNIKQGIINDCYFLSALGALCDKCNKFVKNMFHITDKSIEGAYGINFYINGKEKLILVDDYFPCVKSKKKNDNSNSISFGSSFEHEIWVSLIEKAYAKIRGTYQKTEIGRAIISFGLLTGASTYQIDVPTAKGDLWDILLELNDYPMCAGTNEDTSFLSSDFNDIGLLQKHEYTLMKAYIEEGTNNKRILLRDPYGKDNLKPKAKSEPGKRGLFSIRFEDFLNCFLLVEVAYFKEDFHKKNIKIKKKETNRCQLIRINNEFVNNKIFINLYQNNPDYNPNNPLEPVFGYLMLVKEKRNNENKITYNYIDSISTLNKKGKHDSHIALNNIELDTGVYYLFCDVNIRFIYKNQKIHGYALNIFSENVIKSENVTEVMNGVNIFHESLISFITNIKEKKHDNQFKYEKKKTFNTLKKKLNKEYFKKNLIEDAKGDIKILKFKDRDLFPFDIYYFKNKNKEGQEKTIKFDIIKEDTCIYNDNQFSEFDRHIKKTLKPKEKEIILTMKYNYEFNKKEYVSYKVLEGDYIHPVFQSGTKKEKITGELCDKIECHSINISNGFGKFLGIKNITKSNIVLDLEIKKGFIINPKHWGKKKWTFNIPSNGKPAFAIKAETVNETGKPLNIEYTIGLHKIEKK